MNKYDYQNKSGEEYSQMNVTQQLMAGFGDETETVPAENETADIPAENVSENAAETETEQTAENKNANEVIPAKAAKPTKEKKPKGTSKRKRESRRASINSRLEQLIPFTEKHDEQNAKLHDEINSLKRELRDMDMEDIDGLCKSKGFTTDELINFLRTSVDMNAIKKAAGNINEKQEG